MARYRFLSIAVALALALLVVFVPATVFAEGTDDEQLIGNDDNAPLDDDDWFDDEDLATPTPRPYTPPRTGDESGPVVVGVIAAGVLAGAVVVLSKMRKASR